jgi:cytochrome c
MNDRKNTIAGWVLFAGIVALGASIVSSEVFNSHRPETMGFPIEGVAAEGEGGGEAEQPIAFYLQTADAAKGEAVFKKCAACHNADQGGANALGPALFGTMGKPLAGHAGFAYSDALKGVGGSWVGTRCRPGCPIQEVRAGHQDDLRWPQQPEDRADIMRFLNSAAR